MKGRTHNIDGVTFIVGVKINGTNYVRIVDRDHDAADVPVSVFQEFAAREPKLFGNPALYELEENLLDWLVNNMSFEKAQSTDTTEGNVRAIQARERRVALERVLTKIHRLLKGKSLS